jgi:uncharacterized repeat protein (TIGR01451 family)
MKSMGRMNHPQVRISYGLICLAIAFLAFLVRSGISPLARIEASENRSRPVVSLLSKEASVQLGGAVDTILNLQPGHDFLTTYPGDSPAANALRENRVEPMALAMGDFDEDGVQDLIAAYASEARGLLTLKRGNVDAIYPNSGEAQQRRREGSFTDAPFFPEALIFEANQRPDFIGTGDFNADGHTDIVLAAAGGRSLSFYEGDGAGSLRFADQKELQGAVSVLGCGDLNRRDGLSDIVIGVHREGGGKAIILESPLGAMRAKEEIIELSTVPTSLAIANLDSDYEIDLGIAAGNELIMVKGRDRRLTMGEGQQRLVRPPQLSRLRLTNRIRSIVAGDFSEAKGSQLALLTEDGSVLVIDDPTTAGRRVTRLNERERKTFSTVKRLMTAQLGNRQMDDLLALDSVNREVHLLRSEKAAQGPGNLSAQGKNELAVFGQLRLEEAPVAVLPMRLNGDGLSDIIILRRGRSEISITPSSTRNIFMVNSEADNGPGSLREAIMMANANVGADQINFNLGPMRTISLLSALPPITDPLTIDGTTQPGFTGLPIIELTGFLAGDLQAGLVINATGCTIRGLVINRMTGMVAQGSGILIGANGAIIEGNYIGTNILGDTALGNSGSGVRVTNAGSVTIGGTTAAARNLISANGFSNVDISGGSSTNITVAGNFIGTDAAGTGALTGQNGVEVGALASGNTIGGVVAAARNVISGNQFGVTLGASGNLVQGNFIGVDVTGTMALGNLAAGVELTDSLNGTVGGTVAGARNIISGNNNRGILLFGTGLNLIQGNFIGTNAAGTAGIPNFGGGMFFSGGDVNLIGGTTAGTENHIAFNAGSGIHIVSGENNAILGNRIFSNDNLGINLSDDMVTPNDAGDADTGPNLLQNFPVLTSAAREGGSTRVVGSLQSEMSMQYRIEFFANTSCDGSGNGEGERFLGSVMVTTDAVSGVANFNLLLPSVLPGQVITSTATNPLNNTSEFSECVTVLAGPGTADLSVTKTAAPSQVQAGGLITYTITVRNLGPDNAVNVTLNEGTPANTTFRSLSVPNGWNCSTPAPGGEGTIQCTNPLLSPGTTAVFTLVVRLNASTANGTLIKNTVKVANSTADLNLANDFATANVTAINSCVLNCPANINVNALANQCGATVNFALPGGTGSCGAVACQPPSGSFFQRGTTAVNCSANSGPGCSFTVTVNDTQPPTINCPVNVVAQESPAGSGMTTVTYGQPTTGDNCSGVTVVCTPPSGSVFPVGQTVVSCRATDAGGNTANCTFNVLVQGGPPIIEVIIPAGTPGLVFGGNTPVPVGRKPIKEKNNPCSIFTVANGGFTPAEIILDSVVRIGSDVDNRRIGDANDGALYSVRRLLTGGGETVVPIGGTVVIGVGERVDFCVKFNPVLPAVPNSATNIPAAQVIADRTNSRVTFRLSRGNPFSINTVANVATGLVLIDPVNTRRPALLTFERVGNEFVLTYSLFDSNQDVQRMKVELLDGGGAVVASFDIDLVEPVRARNLVRGQSFTVVQKFSGANDNPEVTGVRLTVSDSSSSVTGTAGISGGGASSQQVFSQRQAAGVDLPVRQIGSGKTRKSLRKVY